MDVFLCFRQQQAVVNASKSDLAPVLPWVPQEILLHTLPAPPEWVAGPENCVRVSCLTNVT